jgi:tRNA modification GTPase
MPVAPASTDTIMALASGAGRGGVAVIRLSGPQAPAILGALTDRPLPQPRRAAVRGLIHPDTRDYLDEAMAILMPGPASFTGEDVVELHVHGGMAVIEAVLAAVSDTGLARLAEPGEFTRRAFENGRLDLTQAESVADLVDAETDAQRRQAARLYKGEASDRYDRWRDTLISAMAALEAAIDFPDEGDVPPDVASGVARQLDGLARDMQAALASADRFRAVREGFRIAILGPPNAGKSSILNRLAGREAAIVSPIAGTTRDVVEVRLVISGFPVWVADTAGLREAADEIEAEGVRRALERAEHADLRLWVHDISSGPAPDVSRETSWREGDLHVLNKADLLAQTGHTGPSFLLSADTGEGFTHLELAIAMTVERRLGGDEAPLVTRARHEALVTDALAHVSRAGVAMASGRPAELVSEDLRLAARSIGRITGAVDVEDLLDRIFSDFCIGK